MLLIISAIIIAYSYYKNYQAIENLAGSELKSVNDRVISNFNDVRLRSILMGELIRAAVSSRKDEKIIRDPFIREFLLKTIQIDPLICGVQIYKTDGNYASALDLLEIGFFHYFSKPNTPLPTGAIYAWRTIDSSKAQETWEYFDSQRLLVTKDNVQPASYIPTNDLWFKKMEEWPTNLWHLSFVPRSDFPQKESAKTISFSMPFYENGTFFGMVETNLSIDSLANFIYEYRISEHGREFILDSEGTLIIPSAEDIDAQSEKMVHTIVKQAYQAYLANKQNFIKLKSDNTKYMVYIDQFPISVGSPWYIVTVVPFEDFFGSLIRNLNQLALVSLGVFSLFGFLIYLFSKHISRPIEKMAHDLDDIRHLDYEKDIKIDSNIEEIVTLENSISALQKAVRSFGKYIPKEIVKRLIGQGKEITLGGKRKEISLMFSDIKDFTTTSEIFPVETLLFSLEKYYEILSDIIVDHQGTIDKYIGDSIMAFWNAPGTVENHAKKACLAALLCHKACNVDYRQHQLFEWTTRFGLHAGEVIVGNIGTYDRMNYTIVGDVVNTASRVTSLNKEYHTSILITEAIKNEIGEEFLTRPIDFIAVRGKKVKIRIYELAGTKQGELKPSPEQEHLLDIFTKAYMLYEAGQYLKAKAEFQEIAKEFPNDTPTQIYLERLAGLLV